MAVIYAATAAVLRPSPPHPHSRGNPRARVSRERDQKQASPARFAIPSFCSEDPDVVFLQEVIPKTLDLFSAELGSQFEIVAGSERGYFTAMMLNRSTSSLQRHEIHPFYSSRMGRNLLAASVSVRDCRACEDVKG